MNIIPTDIPGPVIIEPQIFGDDRGFFMETFQKRIFAEAGLPTDFAQDNHSGSRKGILRGLHYQLVKPQGKLVRVVVGEVFDVAVDLRRSSAYFGRWFGLRLSAENKRIFWVPPGFGHAFYVLSDWAEFLYKATDFYAPEGERTILWNDPQIGIDWPLLNGQPPLVSAKDAAGRPLNQAETFE
ncbi:MAG: dTDP-4-dehydrorhamnose 3,5-epimerase [Chloroflexi bacterium]|nr:MAG: dTDP-4-dehydrorhamnose 3,5-epimerase [Chloroflexota bacterium]